jgi:phosphoglycolate phosphatase
VTEPAPVARARLHPLLDGIELVVFDKDGTLIDFRAMWEPWLEQLATRLGDAIGTELRDELFRVMGTDPVSGTAMPLGEVAASMMERLQALTVEVVAAKGFSSEKARAIVEAAWFAPDPVADAVPLADLTSLFETLHNSGRCVAVVTADDRGPTLQTLAALDVADLVDVVVCADDGHPGKPSPEMFLAACRAAACSPGAAAVVGDMPGDMAMGRAGGAHRTVGVLSGVGRRDHLAPLADVLLDSIADLLPPSTGELPSVA